MNSWPSFNDNNLSPTERRLLVDITLQRLIEKAEIAEKAHIFDQEEVDALKAVIAWTRSGRLFWKASRASFPIIAAVVFLLAAWDKVVLIAKSILTIFRV